MANLFRSLISRRQTDEITRFTTQDYLRWLSTAWNGLVQPMYPATSTYSRGRPAERIENSFTGYVYGAYKVNPIVYGLMTRRSSVFSEARFMWREVLDGKPGDLFWNDALIVLSRPWPNGTTGELLTRMIQDVDLAGNCYIVNEGNRLRRLRPDWVQIILSGNPLTDPDVDVVGYTFTPGGPDAGEPVAYMPDEVCHWCADEETQVLTADGWKDYQSLREGDEVLTLNHETGMSEWQPVLEVCIFPAQRREMVLMEGREFSALTTKNHRWAVERRNSRAGGYVRRWATSDSLSAGDRIPLAAMPADLPIEAKWSDALVEAVAWFWTEGRFKSGYAGRRGRGIQIAQSFKNAENLDRIRGALTTLFGPPVARMSKTGPRAEAAACWRESVDDDMAILSLSANASDVVTQHAPGKIVSTEFLRTLTRAQLELFIHVSMLADNNGRGRLAQKSPAMAEQFALACILSGRPVSIRPGSRKKRGYRMTNVRMLSKRHVYPQETTRPGATFKIRTVDYDGHVWCPRTPNETWLARRNGTVYFTGNSPIPDPDAQYRGMSWLTPVVREIQGDQAATSHKLAFYRNGATLGPIVKLPKEMTPEQFKKFIQADREAHQGAENAYATMYIGGGADVTLAAANMQQLDFKAVQGAGETRLCVASGVPAVIAGVSEGLSGSSLNAGNYGTAKRSFADGTLRTLWRSACAALSTILEVPDDAELWYDESHIAFLREDQQDQAQIDQTTMATIVSGIAGGFEPATVVLTVRPQWSKSLQHSGLMSVQLTPPESDPNATIDGGDVPPPDGGVPPDQARSQSEDDEEFYEVLWALDGFVERAFNPDQARISAGHVGGGEFGSKITPLLEKWLAAGGHGDPLGEAGVSRQTIVKAAKAHGVDVPPRMPLTALKAALYKAVHEKAVAHTGGTLHPEVTEHQARVRRIDAARPLAALAGDIDAASTLDEPHRSEVIGEHITGAEQAGELTPAQADKLRGMLHGDGPEVRQVEVENRIRAAYRDLRAPSPADGIGWVGLADLRQRLSDIPRSELDASLRRMALEHNDPNARDAVRVIPVANRKSLQPRDHEAVVAIGDDLAHMIHFADPSPRPLPTSPTGAGKVKAAVGRMAKAQGVTLIGGRDKTTTFDPNLHAPLLHNTSADSIPEGTRVRVTHQGWALDGEPVEKAKVEPLVRARKAPAKASTKAVRTDQPTAATPEIKALTDAFQAGHLSAEELATALQEHAAATSTITVTPHGHIFGPSSGASPVGKAPAKAAEKAAPAVDPGMAQERAARERFAQIAGKRKVADTVAMVHELVDNESDPAALTHRLQAAQAKDGVDTTRLQELVHDPQALLAEADRMATEAGLTRVGPAPRMPVLFDRQAHKPIAGGIRDGETVELVRPGFVWTDNQGKQVRVADTLVEATGEPLPAAARKATKAAPSGDFRVVGGREAPRWGREHFTALDQLPADEQAAVRDYASIGYQDVNRALRNGTGGSPEVQRMVRGLDKVMSHEAVPEGVIVVSRALDSDAFGGDPASWRGKIFTERGFLSTTLGDKVTGVQARRQVHMTIEVPGGTPGYWMAGTSKFKEERELLLGRGLDLEIVSADYVPQSGKWKVRARVVPKTPAAAEATKAAKKAVPAPPAPMTREVRDMRVIAGRASGLSAEDAQRFADSGLTISAWERAAKKSAPAAPSLTPVKGAPDPNDPARQREVEDRIKQAYARIMTPVPARGRGGQVQLADLRRELGNDIPRDEVDAALTRLNRTSGVDLTPETGALTQADHDAAIRVGGTAKHAIQMKLSALGDQLTSQQSSVPASAHTDAEVESAIQHAMGRLGRGDSSKWVSVADLRDALAAEGITDPAQVDDALRRMGRDGRAHIVPESNQKALTARDRQAAVMIGNTPKHSIRLMPTTAVRSSALDDLSEDPSLDEIRSMAEEDDAIERAIADEPDPTVAELVAWAAEADEIERAAGMDVTPGHERLHFYWTKGAGLKRWITSRHQWTKLKRLLEKHVGPERAKRFAAKWVHEVTGAWPGSDAHRVEEGGKPRGHRIGPG